MLTIERFYEILEHSKTPIEALADIKAELETEE